MPFQLPPFDALPLQKDGPPLNAWGLFGDNDELGRANLIDAAAVKRGLEAAKEGIVVNLNLPLDIAPIFSSRAPLEHRVLKREDCNDDAVTINTQSSTQWDGLRHGAYKDWPAPGQYTFYGGMTFDQASDPSNKRYGIDQFAKHPLTSRAHLLDIPRYLSLHSLPPLDPFSSTTPISLETMKGCAAECGVQLEQGDILVVRTGFTEALESLGAEERKTMGDDASQGWVGVDQSEEMLRWHWETGIAAVATDGVAYECIGPKAFLFHHVFLGGWGMSIGELFDLRQLAVECERLGRWTFLLTSMPLYVPGGIASPPNAQAIL